MQRQLASSLHLIPDKRARDDGVLLDDILCRKRELDFKGPHEDEEQRFHPVIASVPRDRMDVSYSLDEREAIADAGSRSSQEGHQIAPHARQTLNSIRYFLPPLGSETGIGSNAIRKRLEQSSLELGCVLSPKDLRPVHS